MREYSIQSQRAGGGASSDKSDSAAARRSSSQERELSRCIIKSQCANSGVIAVSACVHAILYWYNDNPVFCHISRYSPERYRRTRAPSANWICERPGQVLSELAPPPAAALALYAVLLLATGLFPHARSYEYWVKNRSS